MKLHEKLWLVAVLATFAILFGLWFRMYIRFADVVIDALSK